ncbi:WD40 repeat domain-containing protein [Zavarzinella formosa]|uniref:WD40 repeat domain-containing protein n=1 Tax=Zavarzinella formosa TaxID=360055 RepID=UPI0002EC9EE2|nr:WD40 repeat domain-containing protein [Zavarzinella formosa]
MLRVVRPAAVLTLLASVAILGGQEKKTEPEAKLPVGVRLRLGTDRFREPSYISAAAMSPDGREIAVCSGSTNIRFVNAETGREIRSMVIGEYLRTNQLFFTPDGKQLVTAGYNGIHAWSVTDGKKVNTIPPVDKDRRDGQINLSEDGKVVSTSTMYENALVKVMQLSDGAVLGTIKPVHNSTLYSALSPKGDLVATWGQHYARGGNPTPADTAMPRTVHIWDVKTAKQIAAVETDVANVMTVKFSPDGKHFATVGYGVIQLWEAATGKQVRRFAGRGSSNQTSIAFSPDGKSISVSASHGSVQSWDVTTGKRIGQCEGPTISQVFLHYRPDGQLLAWGINTNTLVLWEAPSGKSITPVGGHFAPATSLQFTPDNKHLLSCGQDGRMIRWETDTGKELEPVELREDVAKRRTYGYPRTYNSPALFSPNCKFFIGSSADGSGTSVWDADKNQELFALAGGNGYVDRNGVIVFSPDSKKLVAINRYNGREVAMTLPVWDVETSLPLPPLKGQKGDFTAAAFSTDGAILTTCSYSYSPQGGQVAEAWSWDIATGKVLSKTQLPNTQFMSASFLDHRLFVAFANNSLQQKIYDALTGQEVRPLEGTNNAQASCMTLSPDRRLIGMGMMGNNRYAPNGRLTRFEVRLVAWEAASGTIRHEFNVAGVNVMAMAFSRDGRTLAVSLSDTTIMLFDLDQRPESPEPLKPADLTEIWKTLEEPSARKAYAAMTSLIARPAEAVPFLTAQLKPSDGAKPDATKIAKFINDLDSPRYIVRETAMKELERLGGLARDAVKEALEKKTVSPEMRERLEKLTDKTNKPDSGTELLRPLRTVETLERMNTTDARAHLQTLADGGDSPVTRAAKEALQRLGVR